MTGREQSTEFENEIGSAVVRMTPSDGARRPSQTVVAALDSLPEYDAATSDEVLADAVDPDALDALFRTQGDYPRNQGEVVFPVAGYQITVRATGEVVVAEEA